jgi:hypothetical protein
LFIGEGLPGVFVGENVKVRLADGLRRVPQPKAFCHGGIDADKAALAVFEIDMVWNRFEQAPEKGLLISQFLSLDFQLGLTELQFVEKAGRIDIRGRRVLLRFQTVLRPVAEI